MKKILLSFCLTFSFLTSTTQETQLPFSFSLARNLTRIGDEIYISDQGFDRIYSFDSTIINPTLNTVLDNNQIQSVWGLESNNNNLIFSEESPQQDIEVFDTSTNSLNNLFDNVLTVRTIHMDGNMLYFYSETTNELFRSDISQVNPTAIQIALNPSLNSILVVGNILYFTDDNNVFSGDISISSPTFSAIQFDTVNGFSSSGIRTLQFYNGEIYATRLAGNEIVKFNLNVPNPILEEVITTNNSLYSDMLIDDNDIYLLKSSILSKISLNTLPVKKQSLSEIKIYPNPTKNIINVESNGQNTSLEFFSLSGQLLKTYNSNKIDISDLPSGIYLLKLSSQDGSSETKRIIKR